MPSSGDSGSPTVVVLPLTAARWDDLQSLFTRPGPRGGTPMPGSSCWCMWWRQRTGDVDKNRVALRAKVQNGEQLGLVAYIEGEPIGWVSVAERETFNQLITSPRLGPEDRDDGVWAVVCFYVDPRWKGRGIATALLNAAIEHAQEGGAVAVEAYPHLRGDYMGSLQMFEAAGFEAVRSAGKRVVVRRPRTTRQRRTR